MVDISQPKKKLDEKKLKELGLPTPLDEMPDDEFRSALEATEEEKMDVVAPALEEALAATTSKIEEQERLNQEIVVEQHTPMPEEQKPESPPVVVATQAVSPAPSVVPAQVLIEKDPIVAKIESVLSEGLNEEFAKLSPADQQRFKVTGEETATQISKLLAKSKIHFGQVVQLIVKWLRIIPGVNKYFLEQEAKIKADEIFKLKDDSLF